MVLLLYVNIELKHYNKCTCITELSLMHITVDAVVVTRLDICEKHLYEFFDLASKMITDYEELSKGTLSCQYIYRMHMR